MRIGKNGAIKDDRMIKEEEEILIRKANKLSPAQKTLLRHKSELSKYSDELGGYVHMYYVKNELLFNSLNLERAHISRLIYLSTYIDYNNRQENLLIKYVKNKKIKEMTRLDIKQVLKLSEKPFINFMNSMKKNNLIFEVNGKFYISNEYFSKGNNNFKNKEYTRIFIDTTRLLYENCSTRQHKQLSYAFQLIPKLHYETNVLCANPGETDRDKIVKLGLRDICEFLGISTEKAPMNKFENDLYKLVISINNKKYYMFKRVILKGGNGKFDYFIINPQIIWSGRNTDTIKDTIENLTFIENKESCNHNI